MSYDLKVFVTTFLGVLIFVLLLAFFIEKNFNNFKRKRLFLISFAVIIFLSTFLIYYNYLNNFKNNIIFELIILVSLGSIIIIIILYRKSIEAKRNIKKNKILENYLESSNNLIEKYSITIHKYKNNLIAIKGYLKENKNEAIKYIDSLLENYKTKKYNWFRELNYIPNETIKYLVYYKLSKAEDSELKIMVLVSKDLKKIKEISLPFAVMNIFLEMLGEFFDNALFASRKSKEKELNFSLYLEENDLIFKIANSYKGKIDLKLIEKKGYTTKKIGHGLGLYDISKKVKNIKEIEYDYELLNNYFVVTLKLKNIKNIKC